MSRRLIAAGRQVRLCVAHSSDVGECRRTAASLASAHGFDEDALGRISIVATELATNLVRHAGGGEMLVQMLDDGMRPQLDMLAIDRGPGMRDVARCMRDGYSTAGTPGTGLGAVLRLSSVFDVFSAAGEGTVALARIGRKTGPAGGTNGASRLEFGAVCVALAGEVECGDTWRIADGGSTLSMLVADGLGHGPLAAVAAREAAQTFAEAPEEAPSVQMQRLHQRLAGGRGAVGACLYGQLAKGAIDYAGVGNISGSIVEAERSRGLVSQNGTLGSHLPRVRQFSYEWPAGSVLVMHSDGLSARWSLGDHPGLWSRHSGIIAGVLFRECARKRDDATVVVARYRP